MCMQTFGLHVPRSTEGQHRVVAQEKEYGKQSLRIITLQRGMDLDSDWLCVFVCVCELGSAQCTALASPLASSI